MPRVAINKRKYMITDLYAYIYGEMRVNKISQEVLGKECGLSQQVLGKRLKNQTLDIKDLITIFSYFDTPEEKIIYFLKEKK